MEEREVVEKRTVRRDAPLDEIANVNVGPDGATNVERSGGEEVVEEERTIEEHEHRHP
jgi:hypothetical protein